METLFEKMSTDASSSSIPARQVAELFQCSRCLEAPAKPPVFTCTRGHLTCSTCHSEGDVECSCNEPLLGRNQVLEDVVRSLPIKTCTAIANCTDYLRRAKSEQTIKYLEDPLHLVKLEKARRKTAIVIEDSEVTSVTSHASLANYRASHRPVLCPYPCGRYVTCSGLFPHFEFHHNKVNIQNVLIEKTYRFDLHYDDVIFAESRCQVFFVVHLTDKTPEISCSSWRVADLMKLTKSPSEMLRNGMFISTLTVGVLSNSLDTGDDGSALQQQFMAMWGTCLYHFSPVTYTMQVSSVVAPFSLSFTGPLTSLHYSQRPTDVYTRGECLLLTPGLLREMCFSPDNNLQVAVTFHNHRLTIPGSINDHYLGDDNLVLEN